MTHYSSLKWLGTTKTLIMLHLNVNILKRVDLAQQASRSGPRLKNFFHADMKMCSLRSIDPPNREAWGLGVRHSSHLAAF